jgi:hypothetical protein
MQLVSSTQRPAASRCSVVIADSGNRASVVVLDAGYRLAVGSRFWHCGVEWQIVGRRQPSGVLVAKPAAA